jgi:1,4-alpha-glucan branching enzyme
MSLPYLYRIVNAQGATVYRTDIFSRSQIGKGDVDPALSPWSGTADTLRGSVGGSVVIDPDVVRRNFASTPAGQAPDLIPADEFWASEFTSGLAVPTRLEDIVIYELHVGSLGIGKAVPGDLSDAMQFLDHLAELGVNAVELMPMAQFSNVVSWGYGDTHHMCIESNAGGRDKYRHFVRECHRRGIAVLQDVVYNHYDNEATRAEWQYDSTAPEQNILAEQTGNGQRMFRFYQDAITLSRRLDSVRGRNIDILHQNNANRVIAFKRWSADEQAIVVASFNNNPFANGYVIEKDLAGIPDAGWKEIFNSDAAIYGGQNVGNYGATIGSAQGRIAVRIPANGLMVFVKQ